MTASSDTADASQQRAPAIVFIHGSGDSAREWDAVIARLPQFQTVALDLPGHGSQLDRPGPAVMSVADYADTVRAALMRRELNHVCLVGHSLGGAIALQVALDHPSLVSRLVLAGTGARLRVLPAVLEAARAATGEAARELATYGFAPGHEAVARTYAASLAPSAPGMLYRDLAACDAFDVMADLGRIAQPALVLVGEADRLTPPKYAQYLCDHLDNATLVTVSGAGHYLPAEAPDAVAGAIVSWLAAHSG
jgi:pimeloyl-ACP methyl ester carboxylesterase